MRKVGGGTVGSAGFDTAPGLAVDTAVSWPRRLAKVRVMRVSKGTGWAIGAMGVLTARQVIEPLLPAASGGSASADSSGAAQHGKKNAGLHIGHSAEIVIGASPERSFDATVIWQSESAGLALLKISERNLATWKTLLRSTPETMLACPPQQQIDPVTAVGLPGRVGGTETSTVAWMLTPPEHIIGILHPVDIRDDTSGAQSDLAVDRKLLPRAARRHGMPGGVVLSDIPTPSLLGIVTSGPRGRRGPRFDIAMLPNPATDTDFAAALEAVGAKPIVFNMDGPTLQQYLRADCLDEALRPRTVRDTTELGWFGTQPARTDISEPADPYFGWVSRPERQTLSTAIDRALAGDGPRFIVLRGPSAAGKSRLAAEVIRSHSGLAHHALLAPRLDRSILDLPRRLLPESSVIFIDNIQDHP
ncbi:MAG: hypothetical protein ABI382_05725, partial [Nakamurella sp.]